MTADSNTLTKVVDCRVCGDPNYVLRFAFIEFMDEGKVINLLLEMNGWIVESGYIAKFSI